ncbi:GDSL-type esterase/lipase family protein [Microbacterium thalli]|uniref:GDSL-type esterase/lipase family protein n=1 Tax=Microbacterium thalli TaxID=3027921 RepID=UPI003455728F
MTTPTGRIAAAVGGVALSFGAVAVASHSVLSRQAAIARDRIGKPLGEAAVDADRLWRRSFQGEPIRLIMLGDSLAAGLGAERPKDTLGGRLAKGLAHRTHRPVRLRTGAVVGAESATLRQQIESLGDDARADVAVIVVGGNDVTHRVPAARAARSLGDAVALLRSYGCAVVVGTCPDLGALRPVPQPLRSFASRASRALAAAQESAASAAGARVVSLRRTVGPVFVDRPDEMFSLDRFHPSPLGYRRTADALLPSVLGAVDESTSARMLARADAVRLGGGMADPTPESWRRIDSYLTHTLVEPDEALAAAVADQNAAGLPAIEVAPLSAKLLQLLIRISGAANVLEIGTLGGYSAIAMARALPPGGRLLSIEAEQGNAEMARRNIERAGVDDRVEVRVGRAAEVLPDVDGPFDLVFIDADKESNTLYLEHAARVARVGAVVVVDNVVRSGRVADPATEDEQIAGVRRGLEKLARDPRFDATALQTLDAKGWDGLAIAVRVDPETR